MEYRDSQECFIELWKFTKKHEKGKIINSAIGVEIEGIFHLGLLLSTKLACSSACKFFPKAIRFYSVNTCRTEKKSLLVYLEDYNIPHFAILIDQPIVDKPKEE